MAAFEERRQRDAMLAVQLAGVENVERQLAEGRELIELEGRLVQRESAWAAAAGIRATWGVEGARQTGRVVFEQGQWWAYVLVPLGEYPG